jgi:ribosomal protein L11 methyltransferase
LIRLAVRCPAEQAEVLLAELLEMAPSGVEQIDAPDGLEGVVEYAVYGAGGELPELGGLDAVAGAGRVEVRAEEVPDDWTERWKRFYFPVLVGGRLYVRPPWEEPAHRGGVEEVVVDPGGAFGTGTHPTTRMCLELLLEADGRGSFCDLGCGSGVLSIAAVKLGFGPVLGADADRTALDETLRNARANGTEVKVLHVDLRREAAPVADAVAANLTAGLCEAVAQSWAKRGVRPGTAIVSGFLREEADGVEAALAEAGLEERRRVIGGEWAAILAS